MSDATRKTMIEAIGAHVSDEAEGAYLMDWVLVGYIPKFGEHKAEPNSYYMDSSQHADHVSRGLLYEGLNIIDIGSTFDLNDAGDE